MNAAELAGRVTLRPGPRPDTVEDRRPVLAGRLCTGRPARDLPALLGSLFSLCGHAHRLAARLAVGAAQGPGGPGWEPEIDHATHAELRRLTARDQALRIAHDWPRLLPGPTAAEQAPALAASLASCPLWAAGAGPLDADRLAAWLNQAWLGLPPAEWLARYEQDPVDWPIRWSRSASTPLAALLRAQHGPCARLATGSGGLQPLRQPEAAFGPLAASLRALPETELPAWAGGRPDTGPWRRHHDPVKPPAHNAWVRLLSRLTDLLHLSRPGGGAWLAVGALQPAEHEGIAWVEMARGLLVHWVRLQPGADGPTVAALRVLSPTDWNFHPEGVLARALRDVREPDDVRRLAVAFDPCVAFDIDTPEPAHA